MRQRQMYNGTGPEAAANMGARGPYGTRGVGSHPQKVNQDPVKQLSTVSGGGLGMNLSLDHIKNRMELGKAPAYRAPEQRSPVNPEQPPRRE